MLSVYFVTLGLTLVVKDFQGVSFCASHISFIMSTITEIEDERTFTTLVSTLSSSTLLAISFHTPWAAPCAQMSLILQTLASSYPPQNPPIISFLSINAESLPEISESYDVTAVPFLVLQRGGKVLESVSGSDASKIRDAVERHAGKGGHTSKTGLPPALETTSSNNGESGGEPANDLSGRVSNGNPPAAAPEPLSSENHAQELNKRLAELVKAAPVMLFMKGTPSSPQCGFSRTLVGILREKGVRYGFFNILADEEVRQGLKDFSYVESSMILAQAMHSKILINRAWPTFPQLYRKGELVGGLDIVKEELESDPNFFAEFSVGKGKGEIGTSDAIKPTATASV